MPLLPTIKDAVNCERYQRSRPYKKDITLNFPKQPIATEIADTNLSREKGLSGRECMHKNQAMLFVFDENDQSNHCFWMKNMRFPIDIYWLSNDKKVVYSATGVQPNSYPKQFCPNVKSQFVLELSSGTGNILLLDYKKSVPFDL